MPDFYDGMYEQGFEDPQDYMDYLENQAINSSNYSEHDSGDVESNDSEHIALLNGFKSASDQIHYEELVEEYLEWCRKDSRGELLEEYYVHFHQTFETLCIAEENALNPREITVSRSFYKGELLKRLENWRQWLSLTRSNEERYHTECIQSKKGVVDSLLRTLSICKGFKSYCFASWNGEDLFDRYPYLRGWISSFPDFNRCILSPFNGVVEKVESVNKEYHLLETILWAKHYLKNDESEYSLFKCLENGENREWERCFNSFLEKDDCSGSVFNAWERAHKEKWTVFCSSEESLQIRRRIAEKEKAKSFEEELDERFFASLAADDPIEANDDAPVNCFVDSSDWYYNYLNGKEDIACFKLWRDKNQTEWREWVEEYLWRENMGGFRKRFVEKHAIQLGKRLFPLYLVRDMTISVFNSWITNHSSQWKEYLNSVDIEYYKEAWINTILVYSYLKKCEEKQDIDYIALGLGDYFLSNYDDWSRVEQIHLQGEKERSLKFFGKEEGINSDGRGDEWDAWIMEVDESLFKSSFDCILQEWYRINEDERVVDYYDRCIYLYWFTILSKRGRLDSSFAFKDLSWFY